MSDNKRHRNRLLAIGIIVIPMVVAIVYYAIFSSDRYVTQAQVVVRQAGSQNPSQQVPGLSLLLSGLNPASREETLYLREFIRSQDMLNVLQTKLKWSEHFAGRWNDPLYWLWPDTPNEDLLKFYRRLVTVHFDELTGLLLIEVEALTPEFSEQVTKVILAESERFVNEISHRMAREQMRFAQSELALARKAYEEHRERMIRFQSENRLLDAEASAESRATIISELESQLTAARANLRGLLSNLSSDSPQVKQLRTRITSLEKQIAEERNVLVSESSGGQLNVVAAQYRDLLLEAGIAEEAYKLSVAALENARIEANKKIRTLVTVVSPNQAQSAIYPKKWYNLFTLLIGLMLIYGIARFVIASIEDHRD